MPSGVYNHKSIPADVRFWRHVEKIDGGCWLWTGTKISKGYGNFNSGGGVLVYAHHFSYVLVHGSIPDGLWVLHTCDTPACVKPEHLFLGTVLDNNVDMAKKLRHGQRKLTLEQVEEIRSSTEKGSDLAARFGVNTSSINKARSGKTWAWLEA